MRVLAKGRVGNAIDVLAFSPDSRKVAAIRSVIEPIEGSQNEHRIIELHMWDPLVETELYAVRLTTGPGRGLCFSPDGRTLAVCNGRKKLLLCNPEDGTSTGHLAGGLITRWDYDSIFASAEYLPDGSAIISGMNNGEYPSYGGELCRWPLDTQKKESLLRAKLVTRGVRVVALSPIGDRVFLVDGMHTLRSVNLATPGKYERAWPKTAKPPRALAVSPEGTHLAVGSAAGVTVWNVETREQIAQFKGHRRLVSVVAFSPDGRLLASGSADGTVRFWDTDTMKERADFTWGHSEVLCLGFSPDGTMCAAGGRGDVELVVWDVEG